MTSFWTEVLGMALSDLIARGCKMVLAVSGLLLVVSVVDAPERIDRLLSRRSDERRPRSWQESAPAPESRGVGAGCATPECRQPYAGGSARYDAREPRRTRDEPRRIRVGHGAVWQSEQAQLGEWARQVVHDADRTGACKVKHSLHNLASRAAARWLDRRALQGMQPLLPRLERLCPQLEPVPFGTLLALAGSKP